MEKKLDDLIKLLKDKSAEHITLFDVSEITTVTKYIFIMTANSTVHAESLCKYIIDYLIANDLGSYLMSKNYTASNPWILLDASELIFHIFNGDAREYYNLEKLYFRGKVLFNE